MNTENVRALHNMHTTVYTATVICVGLVVCHLKKKPEMHKMSFSAYRQFAYYA